MERREGGLLSVDEIAERVDGFLERYQALPLRSPYSGECTALVKEFVACLREAAEHGRYVPGGSPERRALKALIDDAVMRLRVDGHQIDGVDALARFDEQAGVVLDVRCPYRGLDAYDSQSSAFFVGREALSRDFAKALEAGGTLLIVGASGSGKSSVALAGVLPVLRDAHEGWANPAVLKPGALPVMALARAAAAGRGDQAARCEKALREHPDQAPAVLAELCAGKPLVLVVDQLEELVTLCADPAEQKAFAAILLALASPDAAPQWRCLSLFTLRTDQLARLESSEHLNALHQRLTVPGCYFHLPALGVDDIRRAIVTPAEKVGLRFIPATIAQQLASQTAGLVNGLPLLQFALQHLWETRPVDAQGLPLDFISARMVAALPDVHRALGTVAEGLYRGFSSDQKAICERMVQELVLLDDSFEAPMRRSRALAELREVVARHCPGTSDDAAHVYKRFHDARLLREFGEGEDAQVEVAHEALLRHWERIYEVVSGQEVKRRLHTLRLLEREAREWQEQGRRADFLKQRGRPLADVLAYACDGWIKGREVTAYVEACRDFEDEENRREEALKAAREATRRAAEAQQRAVVRADTEKARADVATARADAGRARAREARSRLRLSLVAAALLAVVLILFWQGARSSRDASLNAMASLADRLLPWEGLDVAYNVAHARGEDFRFALAHALERTDHAWLPGRAGDGRLREGQLRLLADGGVVVCKGCDKSAQDVLQFFQLVDGALQPRGAEVKLAGVKAQLVEVEVGPPIRGDRGARRLLVLLFGEVGEVPRVQAYLLDFSGERAEAKPLKLDPPDGMAEAWKGRSGLSMIHVHPDGDRAVWSVADYDNRTGDLLELQVDLQASSGRLRVLPDPAGGTTEGPASAVAYLGDEIVTGRQDGGVYCGGRRIESAHGIDAPTFAVRRIAVLPEQTDFVLGRLNGEIRFADCHAEAKKTLPTPGAPEFLRLALQNQAIVASFLDEAHAVRCYTKDGSSGRICRNASYAVTDVALLPDARQVVVEQGGSESIRVHAGEVDGGADKALRAQSRGPVTVHWRPAGDRTLPKTAGVEGSPWAVPKEGGVSGVTDGRFVEAAALSPAGKWLAWIEPEWNVEQRRRDFPIRVMPTAQLAAGKLPPPSLEHKDLFGANLFAVDDAGWLVYPQVEADKTGPSFHLYLQRPGEASKPAIALNRAEGQPTCLAFSPGNSFLVLGTESGKTTLWRIDRKEGSLQPVRANDRKDGRKVAASSCVVASDGAIAVGYGDGTVDFVSADGARYPLAERAVHAFPVSVRELRFQEPSDPPRRLIALGDWQLNSCVHPGLPGQAIRVWELPPGDPRHVIPASVACFPNQPIAGLGAMDDSGVLSFLMDGPSLAHRCLGCSGPGESAGDVRNRLLRLAEERGARRQFDKGRFERRYGFTLD